MSNETDKTKQWSKREQRLLEKIAGTQNFYTRFNRRIIRFQRIVSVAIMMGGAVAPVLVAGSGVKDGLFGIDATKLNSIAIVLTVTLAVLERA